MIEETLLWRKAIECRSIFISKHIMTRNIFLFMPISAIDVVLAVHSLSKIYQIGETKVEVLKDITINVNRGEFLTVSGPSGSGKTTLLNIISGIDKPTNGQVVVLGQDLTIQNEDFPAHFRCNNVGFVFRNRSSWR